MSKLLRLLLFVSAPLFLCDSFAAPGRVVDIPPDHEPSAHEPKDTDFGNRNDHSATDTDDATRYGREIESETAEVIRVSKTLKVTPRQLSTRSGASEKMRTFAIVPSMMTFRAVFGRAPFDRDEAEMHKRKLDFEAKGITVFSEPNDGVSSLDLAFTAAAEDGAAIFTLIGHSELKGGVRGLVLPTGEFLPLETVHLKAAAVGIACFIITCHGSDLQIEEEIDYDQALRMWQAGTDNLKSEDVHEQALDFIKATTDKRQVSLSRDIQITFSPKPGDSFGPGRIAADEIVILHILMRRTSVFWLFCTLLLFTTGTAHWALSLKRKRPVSSSASIVDAFRAAAMGEWDRLKRTKTAAPVLLLSSAILWVTGYAVWKEGYMDWVDQEGLVRPMVYAVAILAGIVSVANALIAYLEFEESALGAFVHRIVGAHVGATFALLATLKIGVFLCFYFCAGALGACIIPIVLSLGAGIILVIAAGIGVGVLVTAVTAIPITLWSLARGWSMPLSDIYKQTTEYSNTWLERIVSRE